jgi:hypothetical protein
LILGDRPAGKNLIDSAGYVAGRSSPWSRVVAKLNSVADLEVLLVGLDLPSNNGIMSCVLQGVCGKHRGAYGAFDQAAGTGVEDDPQVL